jgi:hypothetical protein
VLPVVGPAQHLRRHEAGDLDSVVPGKAADTAVADDALNDDGRPRFEFGQAFLERHYSIADLCFIEIALGGDVVDRRLERPAGGLVVGPE